MALPTISVINFTELNDSDVQRAVRAINRQIAEDFAPVWGANWELLLHASAADPADPDSLEEEPVRGEGVLYLIDESTLPGALGFHDINTAEIPFGFVFLLNQDDWTVTLSHEALELIIDPTANVLVPGPDPRDPNGPNVVLHAYEVCDAVERTSYTVDHIRVSNFITPSWFFEGDAPGTRNDFLGVGVDSFGATPGSHLAFLDLQEGWQVILGQDDAAQKAELGPAQRQRLARYSHERARPDEIEVNKALQEYKLHPVKRLAGRPQGGLPHVHGLTRSSRKEAVAMKLLRRQET